MIVVPFIVNCLFNFAVGIILAKLLGPSEYGRFALVMSIAVVLQTLGFDWLRLSATRFYSEQSRQNHPEIRATLDAGFLAIMAGGLLLAIILAASGEAHLTVPPRLVALSIVTAGAVALFETSAALLRARLAHVSYAVFVIVKNGLSLGLTAGAAWYFQSATFALAGLILSVLGSFAACYPMLRDPQTNPRSFDLALARRFLGYGLPIVIANIFYFSIPMVNRAMVSHVHDFTTAGQIALAYDLGNRIIGSLGAALDVLLFQIAVVTERTSGRQAARHQISRNMGLVLAAILPVALGCWLVLPSFEALFIPQAFRGPFAHYFVIMLPGFVFTGLAGYCFAPVFQIAHRTAPLIWGGVAAFLANILVVFVMPSSADATIYAIAQSASSAVGMFTIMAFMSGEAAIWPSLRDLLGICVSILSMLIVDLPLSAMTPGIMALLTQAFVGATIYVGCLFAFNVGDLRGMAGRFYKTAVRRDSSTPPVRTA